MKIKIAFFAIALMSSTSASASMGFSSTEVPRLERGVSDTQILSMKHPKRYQLELDRSALLRIASQQPNGSRGYGSFISATLYDAAGRSVAESSSDQGSLYLSRQVEPGVYQLEVSGWTPSGKADGLTNRYELHVAY